jgi:hypothetical protein
VSRQWRDLLSRKRFGAAHDNGKEPENGSLAYFCVACPQPGINLPIGWRNDPKKYCFIVTINRHDSHSLFYRWLYQRSYVVDGNFHADHVRMKWPEDDVALADGLAYMVETAPYEEHLSESVETKQVRSPYYPSGRQLTNWTTEIWLP